MQNILSLFRFDLSTAIQTSTINEKNVNSNLPRTSHDFYNIVIALSSLFTLCNNSINYFHLHYQILNISESINVCSLQNNPIVFLHIHFNVVIVSHRFCSIHEGKGEEKKKRQTYSQERRVLDDCRYEMMLLKAPPELNNESL